jgi:RNA polymerase-binding transcription factor DksA
MATKKQPPKKAAKAAKPAKKAPAKSSRPSGGKPAAKKTAKPVAKKAAKKAVPAKKPSKPAPPKKLAKPSKPAPKTPAKKPVLPAKKATVAPIKKAAPPAVAKTQAKPEVQPVKKPAVAAPTHQEIKPAIRPLEKQAPKKEPPKPVKVVIPKTSTTRAVKYDPDFTKSVLDTPNNENTGPTMRYSDAELGEFKDLILKKLETAKKELAYLQGLITRKDEGGDMEDGRYMTMEDGSMSMEREQLSQMASRQIQFIDHLEKAMMRIENKTYGICRVTGKLIDKARLRAVPHATLSIEAKQMMNK